jgi:hypothetical protein
MGFLKSLAGSMNFLQDATAASTAMHEPPAPFLMNKSVSISIEAIRAVSSVQLPRGCAHCSRILCIGWLMDVSDNSLADIRLVEREEMSRSRHNDLCGRANTLQPRTRICCTVCPEHGNEL